MSERIDKLLELAGKNSLDGCDPLNHSFLVEHNVTSDECFHLSKLIGNAVVGYARSGLESRMIDDLKAEFDDPAERRRALDAWKYAVAQTRLKKVREGMSAI